jgi:hypothetical protein
MLNFTLHIVPLIYFDADKKNFDTNRPDVHLVDDKKYLLPVKGGFLAIKGISPADYDNNSARYSLLPSSFKCQRVLPGQSGMAESSAFYSMYKSIIAFPHSLW